MNDKKTPQRSPQRDDRVQRIDKIHGTRDHSIKEDRVRQDSEKSGYVTQRVPDEKRPPKK
jgi:hypothetical protein